MEHMIFDGKNPHIFQIDQVFSQVYPASDCTKWAKIFKSSVRERSDHPLDGTTGFDDAYYMGIYIYIYESLSIYIKYVYAYIYIFIYILIIHNQ